MQTPEKELHKSPLGNLMRSPRTYRLAVGCFFFMQGLIFSSWANRIPDIKAKLGINDAVLGTLLFAIPMGQMLVMWLSGILVTRFGSRTTARCAVAVYPVILICIGLSNSVAALFAMLVAFGMAANLHNISINTQAVDVEAVYGRSVMSSFHGVWSLSGFCGGILSGFLVAHAVSVEEQFVGVAAAAYIMLVFVSRLLVERDIQPEKSGKDAGKTRGFLNPTPLVITLGFISFGSMSCEGIMFDWSVIYFKDAVSAPENLSHMGYIAFMFTMAGGRFLGDRLIMRFGAMNVLLYSGLTIFAGMMTAVAFPSILSATIGFLMVGFGVSTVVPTCFSLAGRSRRMNAGVAIAAVSTIGFFGFLMGPPLIGYVSYALGIRYSFAIMACVGLTVSALSHTKALREACTGIYTDGVKV